MTRRRVGALLVVAAVAGLAVYSGTNALRVWRMQRDIEGVEREVDVLRDRREGLISTVNGLRNDPDYIEKLAREELGMVREGETVLKFPSRPLSPRP